MIMMCFLSQVFWLVYYFNDVCVLRIRNVPIIVIDNSKNKYTINIQCGIPSKTMDNNLPMI
jgi:hypothetical protein